MEMQTKYGLENGEIEFKKLVYARDEPEYEHERINKERYGEKEWKMMKFFNSRKYQFDYGNDFEYEIPEGVKEISLGYLREHAKIKSIPSSVTKLKGWHIVQ